MLRLPPRKASVVFAILAATALLFASCATLFSGSNDTVRISSNPAGAEVFIDGAPYGKTPLTLKLQKDNYYHVAISHEGYETAYVSITSREGIGWIILDAIFLGAPMIIDAITGAWASLTPDNISVRLDPITSIDVNLPAVSTEANATDAEGAAADALEAE